MNFIDNEFVRVAQRSQIVIVLASVPNNYVLQLETDTFHHCGQIGMEGIEFAALSQIHNIQDAILTVPQHAKNPLKDSSQLI